MTVNSFLYVYDRSTLTLLGSMSLEDNPAHPGGLFSSFGQNACPVFDPRCVYDHYTGRFVVSAFNPSTKTVFLGVSRPSANPSVLANWDVFAEAPSVPLVDFPGLGYDNTNYYVTVVTNSSGIGSLIMVFEKTNPNNPYTEAIDDARPLMPAAAWDSPAFGYFLEASPQHRIRVYAWNNNLQRYEGRVELPSLWTDPDRQFPQCQSYAVDVQAESLRNCVYRFDASIPDGLLYAGHAVKIGGKSNVRWYTVSLGGWPTSGTPSLSSGTVQANTSTFLPAIARSPSGKLGMVVGTGDSGVPMGVSVLGRTPSGAWSPLVNVKTGICELEQIRWGDYFGIAVDPVGGDFWVIGEYWKTQGMSRVWGTWIQDFSVQ